MLDTPTYIFAKVDLPDIDIVGQIMHRRAAERLGQPPEDWISQSDSHKELTRSFLRDVYVALEEAWEEG